MIQSPRRTPVSPPAPTTLAQLRDDAAVEHWIRCAKAAYVAGRTTVEQLEEDIAALLEDRPMPGHFAPAGLPRLPARPGGNIERR